MRFRETPLAGAYIVQPELHRDERGFFARTFCARDFEAHGLKAAVAQCGYSYNELKGTVRGMHYQADPAPEAKVVRCVRGAIYDVIVDMRPSSPTRFRCFGVTLSEENGLALYIPEIFAHGFQTLADDTSVTYQMSAFHAPECERGVRYDDPAIGIEWPLAVTRISRKDLGWELLQKLTPGGASAELEQFRKQ